MTIIGYLMGDSSVNGHSSGTFLDNGYSTHSISVKFYYADTHLTKKFTS